MPGDGIASEALIEAIRKFDLRDGWIRKGKSESGQARQALRNDEQITSPTNICNECKGILTIFVHYKDWISTKATRRPRDAVRQLIWGGSIYAVRIQKY